MARITAYDWPGNVRELENVLERAIILSPGNAAQLLGINPGTLYSRIRKLNVRRP